MQDAGVEGIASTSRLIFSATQAWLAAKAGASYVSPFVGRLDDIGATGMSLIREIVDIFGNFEFSTEVLVTSVRIRSTSWKQRAWAPTSLPCPAAVIEQCFKHPLTDIGLERFLKDWEKGPGRQGLTPA